MRVRVQRKEVETTTVTTVHEAVIEIPPGFESEVEQYARRHWRLHAQDWHEVDDDYELDEDSDVDYEEIETLRDEDEDLVELPVAGKPEDFGLTQAALQAFAGQ